MSGLENYIVPSRVTSQNATRFRLLLVCWLGAALGLVTLLAVALSTILTNSQVFSIDLSSSVGLALLIAVIFSPPRSFWVNSGLSQRLPIPVMRPILFACKIGCLAIVCFFANSFAVGAISVGIVIGSEVLTGISAFYPGAAFRLFLGQPARDGDIESDPHSESGSRGGTEGVRTTFGSPTTDTVVMERMDSTDHDFETSLSPKFGLEEEDESLDESLEDEQELAAEVTQQITRSKPECGGELLVCYFRCELAPHQKIHVCHLPIHPPLKNIPEVQIHQLDGPAANIKITQLERFGLRIETKIRQALDSEEEVLIELIATTT